MASKLLGEDSPLGPNSTLKRSQMKSKKLLGTLGLNFDEIKKSFLTKGQLLDLEYGVYWDALSIDTDDMEKRKNASELTTSLLNILMDFLDNPKIKISISLQSILNTINFLNMFYDINSKFPPLIEQIDRWHSSRQKYQQMLPSYDATMRHFTENSTYRNDPKSAIEKLIKCSATFFPVEALLMSGPNAVVEEKKDDTKLKEGEFRADPVNIISGVPIYQGEECFIYTRIYELISGLENAQAPQVLDGLLTQLRILVPQHMKLGIHRACSTVMALLFLITSLLSIKPFSDVDLLKRSLQVVQPFFFWPTPVGYMAQKTLLYLREELLLSGSRMRSRLKEESAQPLCFVPLVNRPDENGPARVIFNIFDANSNSAAIFSQQLGYLYYEDLDPLSTTSRALSTAQAACVVLNLIHMHGGGVNDNLLKMLSCLIPKEVDELFRKALVISENTHKKSQEDAVKYRDEEVAKIEQEIRSIAQSRKPEHLFEPPLSEYRPEFSDLAFVALPVSLDRPQNISQNNIPPTEIYNKLLANLKKYLHQGMDPSTFVADKDSPLLLKLIISGSDELVHQVFCAIQSLRMFNSELYSRFQFQFFVLPLGGTASRLSSFIAHNDAWYGRHIFFPYYSFNSFLIPSQSVPSGPCQFKNPANKGMVRPGQYLRHILSNFVYDAQSTLDLTVFRCDCWLQPKSNIGTMSHSDFLPDVTIPFIDRFEVGLGVYARQFQIQNDLPDRMPISEICRQKNFNFTPTDVHIQFTTVDPNDKVVDTIADEQLVFQRLVLSHIPRIGEDDHVFPADPISNWLEMYAKQTEKSRQKQKDRRQNLRSRQHVNYVDVYCRKPDQQFLILVDGEVMGPFHRVGITQMLGADDEPIRFPIQTFFPISV